MSNIPAAAQRILIVDDNADAAHVIAELFNLHGAHAVHVANGEEALKIAPNFLPDVVFLDLAMPDMDGFSLLRALKGHPALRAARFIALTCMSQAEVGDRVLAEGVDRHIQKPASLAMLLDELS